MSQRMLKSFAIFFAVMTLALSAALVYVKNTSFSGYEMTQVAAQAWKIGVAYALEHGCGAGAGASI